MALLALSRDWRDSHGVTLLAATVDHGLRPESPAEASSVATCCADWQIPHRTLTLTHLTGNRNLAARAREARYDALSAWAHEIGAETVFLGHTLDDQAETVLMRLARGSGVEGLSGMPVEMHWNGTRFLRPLLNHRRTGLRTWLRERNIGWIEDPTNDDPAFDRVKARQALATLSPLGITAEGLAATADRMARQRQVLEAAANDLTAMASIQTDSGIALDREALRSALPDTAMRVLAGALMKIGANPYRARFRSLEPLYQRILSADNTTATLAGCLIRMEPERVLISPEHGD